MLISATYSKFYTTYLYVSLYTENIEHYSEHCGHNVWSEALGSKSSSLGERRQWNLDLEAQLMFSRTKRQQHWSIYPFVLATLAMSNSSITARSKRPPCVHIMRLLGRHSWVDWKQIYDAPKTSLDAMYFVCGASTSCRIIANPAVYAELWKRYVHLESAHSSWRWQSGHKWQSAGRTPGTCSVTIYNDLYWEPNASWEVDDIWQMDSSVQCNALLGRLSTRSACSVLVDTRTWRASHASHAKASTWH